MFGFLRPCRHHLSPELHALWSAHLCGLCLALRDGAGQQARVTTHVDALVVSVLGAAQGVADSRRAGPCPLRGMRPATVVTGDGARLAASTALLLAADRVADHVEDRDGPFAARPAAVVGKRLATRWARAGTSVASDVGFDPAALLAVPARQRAVESAAGVGLAEATAPTEAAVGAALAHTAVLAGRPDNVAPLDEAGRLLGRLAHLLDAVTDLDEDAAHGRWNPVAASGTSRSAALARCREAVAGIGAALRRVRFDPGPARGLAHALLVHETARAVTRAEQGPEPPLAPWDPARPPGPAPDGPSDPAGPPDPADPSDPPGPRRVGPQRGLLGGCAAAAGLCCTGQLCCADEFPDPWTGQPRQGRCSDCVDCTNCSCDCCDCCSVCGDGDCCCSCDCGS
ncbi:DUF5685 family protein [Actinomycetospora sp. CA-084318]|uniref:DUF5685 family protein n=1 Tax=Actinomycetospora sp. CA-084318 TaxID=3239892 RepID=UPI003D956807